MAIIAKTIKFAASVPLTVLSKANETVNGRQKFLVAQSFYASPDAVFAELSDPARMSSWAGIKLCRLKEGRDPAQPNGTGSLRTVRVGPTSFVEEITSYDPPRGYTYTIAKGSPMKDYRGEVRVVPEGEGCLAQWSVSFKSRIPFAGPVLVNATRVGFALGLKKLSKRMKA